MAGAEREARGRSASSAALAGGHAILSSAFFEVVDVRRAVHQDFLALPPDVNGQPLVGESAGLSFHCVGQSAGRRKRFGSSRDRVWLLRQDTGEGVHLFQNGTNKEHFMRPLGRRSHKLSHVKGDQPVRPHRRDTPQC